MTTAPPLRRQVYSLLIVVSLGIVCARILGAHRTYEPYYHRDDPGKSAASILLPLGAADPFQAAALLQTGHQTWGKLDPREMRQVWPKTRPDPTLTFSANDRSRWDTIRALVEDGTYVIGYRETDPATASFRDYGIVREPEWGTIDRVLRPEEDPERPNTKRFYSSKPPLLPTIMAGEYWLLYHGFGWKMADPNDRWWVIRIMLLTFQALPLLIYLILLSRLADRYGTTDWGRLFVVAAACFATYLTMFTTALNNHIIAACTAMFALYPALSVLDKETRRQRDKETENEQEIPSVEENRAGSLSPFFLVSGFFAAFTAAIETKKQGGKETENEQEIPSVEENRAGSFSPSLLLSLSGFFAAFTAAIELPATCFAVFLFLLLMWRVPKRTLMHFLPAAAIPVVLFFWTNYLAIGRLAPAYGEFGGPWYEYEGSVWKLKPGKEPRGIDWAGTKENRVTYAVNLLVGHHGTFTLTPIYLLALTGMGYGVARLTSRDREGALAPLPDGRGSSTDGSWPVLAGLTAAMTVVVIAFYLWKTTNYGGWTNGPRWLFWLTPFWLLCILPVVDYLAVRRWGRVLAYALLAVSVFSANYRDWNPWRHPWIYQFFDSQGWIPY